MLEKGEACRYKVAGRSMWPFLREGDLLTVSRLDAFGDGSGPEPARTRAGGPGTGDIGPGNIHAGDIHAGDIIAFSHPTSGRLVFHRVVRARADAVRTKGDNLLRSDGWIPRECLLGIVTERRRNGRVRPVGRAIGRRWAGAVEAGLAFAFGLVWPVARAVFRFPLRLLGPRRTETGQRTA